MKRYDVVICGAGIAGVATANYLTANNGQASVLLIDRRQPLSYTTSQSGENFRDYWPQQCMTSLSRRSVALMQELADHSDNAIGMRYSGYDFVSESAHRDMFPARHLVDSHSGLNRLLDADKISRTHPYLAPAIQQVVQVRSAGAIDVYALGSLLLAQARSRGVELVQATVSGLNHGPAGYRVEIDSGDRFVTDQLVLAAGPFVNQLAGMLGKSLPVENILQRKIVIPDPDGRVPRNMPFTIFADPQTLDWNDEDRLLFESEPDFQWLLKELPAGLHVKPESTHHIKLGWAFNRQPELPQWTPTADPGFADVVLRGACRFIPALAVYLDRMPTPVVQYAGYYTRTAENWPLIGPLNDQGLFTVSALSGFGTMCACAAGELCAAWMNEQPLPEYAGHFHPDRYVDRDVMAEIQTIDSDGQL